MDGEQAKVHSHHLKSKHRRNGSSRVNLAEMTSPTETTATTNPIVIVQPLSNNDEMASTSPASSSHVNSKTVHLSAAAENISLHSLPQQANLSPCHEHLNAQTAQTTEIVHEKMASHKKLSANSNSGAKYSPKIHSNSTNPTKTSNKSLSDPTASPARRSIRCRNSNEKSPRQKRSKSESRRRRERKLIAAGEMEVRQANETLMRYLKQCSEMTDTSLSGELEIDKSIDDRYHRKMKSHRDPNNSGNRSSNSTIGPNGDGKSTKSKSMSAFSMIGTRAASFARERLPPSGLSSILQELTADIIPNQDEIYNPFTPVVSPTEGPHTDKMFIQTTRGFRSVSDNTYLKTMVHDDLEKNRSGPLDNDAATLSCIVQKIWILLSNICHGLLAGLALAHILIVVTTNETDLLHSSLKPYLLSVEIYTNSFYCLAILCLVSIFDRMDICRWNVISANESISFRWIIIVMIYMATIILCLTSESFDDRFHVLTNHINSNQSETMAIRQMENNRVLSMWSSLSLARSIGAIFGWFLIGLRPIEDQLYEKLLEMQKYRVDNNN